MTQEEFENEFMKLIRFLFSMQYVRISCIYTPNGESLFISVKDGYHKLTCHHGSRQIYRFFSKSNENIDHIGFLTTYLYNTNQNDNDRKKIIDSLQLEAVKWA